MGSKTRFYSGEIVLCVAIIYDIYTYALYVMSRIIDDIIRKMARRNILNKCSSSQGIGVGDDLQVSQFLTSQ